MKAGIEKQQLADEFVNLRVWAVVGASQDRAKFGHRVFRSLRDAGYTVYPVNPKGGELLGDQVYASLADLPQEPDVVNLVIPPAVTEQVVREAHRQGLSRIWMQPGAESDVAIAYCRENDLSVVYDECAMVRRRFWK